MKSNAKWRCSNRGAGVQLAWPTDVENVGIKLITSRAVIGKSWSEHRLDWDDYFPDKLSNIWTVRKTNVRCTLYWNALYGSEWTKVQDRSDLSQKLGEKVLETYISWIPVHELLYESSTTKFSMRTKHMETTEYKNSSSWKICWCGFKIFLFRRTLMKLLIFQFIEILIWHSILGFSEKHIWKLCIQTFR